MLKPEQKWVVGNKVFPNEAEARFYLKSRCNGLQRKNLIALLGKNYSGEDSDRDVEAMADEILATYNLKLRK